MLFHNCIGVKGRPGTVNIAAAANRITPIAPIRLSCSYMSIPADRRKIPRNDNRFPANDNAKPPGHIEIWRIEEGFPCSQDSISLPR